MRYVLPITATVVMVCALWLYQIPRQPYAPEQVRRVDTVALRDRLDAVPTRGGAGGGRQGFGRGGGPPLALVAQFDKHGDKRLDSTDRASALEHVATLGRNRGRGGGGRGAYLGPAEPGPRVTPSSVRVYPASVPLYDPAALRTLFLQFDDEDWHEQLLAFHNTDVEVPATLRVDGRTYRDVGLHYRGQSSFGVAVDRKHSINLSMDFVHEDQQLGGYRTLNLLNASGDASYLRTALFLHVANQYIVAPRANFLRVVINGESWGVFTSQQQFNKDMLSERYATTDGARWKVPGSPGARGGLEYLADDLPRYKRTFEIKSKDDPRSWAALVELTRVLNETPAEKLESALAPILDVDETLKFLALDNVFVNGDGYWVRASDYAIYLDPKGRFHVLPHDANEVFSSGGGPGMRGGSGGVTLDPLSGIDDSVKPLRSRLLAVPALRTRYLAYVREMATTWLDWNRLGPIAARYHALIDADMKTDTRKLDTYENFLDGPDVIRRFVSDRRIFLLNYKAP